MSQNTKNILDCVKALTLGASLTGVGVFLFNSCGPKPTLPSAAAVQAAVDSLLNNGIPVSTAGTVSDASFYVALVSTLPGSYKIHATDSSAIDPTFGLFTKPCQILEGTDDTTADADITCIVEGEELDLWFNGMELNYNIPPSMCSYFTVSSYYYYTAEAGVGGTANSYSVQLDGTFTNLSPALPVDPKTGKPACKYVYPTLTGDLKNCCTGNYVTTVTTLQSPIPDPESTVTPAPIITPDPIISKVSASWGGSAANCLGGPALDFGTKDEKGFPQGTIEMSDGKGANGVLKIEAPFKKNYLSNTYVANYFDPLNIPPPRIRPRAIEAPYYEFKCLDRAFDIKARIKVQVREWDEVSEFNLSHLGNPNTGGNGVIHNGLAFTTAPNTTYEPGFGGENPINKFLDWDDLEYWDKRAGSIAREPTETLPYYPGAGYPQNSE